MSCRLHDDERAVKPCEIVQFQYAPQLGVDGLQCGRKHTKVDYTSTERLHENQPAVVPISSDEYPFFLLCEGQEIGIRGTRTALFGSRGDIVAEIPKKCNGRGVHVLIGE